MLCRCLFAARMCLCKKQDPAGDPPDRPGPVADERQQTDYAHAVAADPVVRVRQIDRRDGIRAAESEEGYVLHEKRRDGDVELREVQRLQGLQLHVEEQKERDVRGSGLCYQNHCEEVVRGLEEGCV